MSEECQCWLVKGGEWTKCMIDIEAKLGTGSLVYCGGGVEAGEDMRNFSIELFAVLPKLNPKYRYYVEISIGCMVETIVFEDFRSLMKEWPELKGFILGRS